MLSIIGENDPKDVHAGSPVKWPFSVSSDASKLTFTFTITTGPDGADAPEWTVELNDASHEEIWSNYGNKTEVKTDGPANGKKDFSLEVICPKGARYGDTVSVSVNVSAEGETDSMTFNARASQSIMVLKTQIDQEKVVSDSLAAKAWLICGSAHPPLFALSSFLQMLIPFTNRCKYAAFCEIVSALSGFRIIRLSVNCSYNSRFSSYSSSVS